MALNEYSPPPQFEEDQVLSSSGHLNTLVRDTNILLGEYLSTEPGYFAPVLNTNYRGYMTQPDQRCQNPGYYRLFVGAFRHKRNTFAYSVKINNTQSEVVHIRVRVGELGDGLINEHTVASDASMPAYVVGSLNITKLHVGSFYEVFVDVWCGSGGDPIPEASIVYLGETHSLVLDSLSSFLTGTPTVADWQLLSTYVSTLHDYLAEPAIAPSMCAELGIHNQGDCMGGWLGGNDVYANYMITHKHKYLAYQFQVKLPEGVAFNGSWLGSIVCDGNTVQVDGVDFTRGISCIEHTIDVDTTTITVAGGRPIAHSLIKMSTGEVIRLGTKSGDEYSGCDRGLYDTKPASANARTWFYDYVSTDHDPSPLTKKDYFPLKGYVVYRGILDISGFAPSVGTPYILQLVALNEPHFDLEDAFGILQVDYLFETPEDEPYLSGWTGLPLHTAITKPGDCAVRLSNDLTWLYSRSTYLNAVSQHLAPNTIDKGGIFEKRRRYLHYYTMSSDQDGKLTFYINGREQTQSISPGNYHWNSLDLDSVKGLFPGTIYKVTGLSYALEDNEPMPIYDLDLINREED